MPVVGGAPQFGVLRRNDAGVYVCVASSVAGEERSEFTITVEGMAMWSRAQTVAPPPCRMFHEGEEARSGHETIILLYQ